MDGFEKGMFALATMLIIVVGGLSYRGCEHAHELEKACATVCGGGFIYDSHAGCRCTK